MNCLTIRTVYFSSVYHRHGFGLFQAAGSTISWPLGMALNATNARVAERGSDVAISSVAFGILLTVFLLLLLSAALCAWRAVRVARLYRDYQPLSTYGAI